MDKKTFFVAVDDGYAQTKLVGESPTGEGMVRTIMRSSIRPGKTGLTSLGGGVVAAYTTEEGNQFTVSNEIESESTQFDGFHTSQLNRVLVNHALIEAQYSGKSVHLITGLPVADFYLDGEKDEDHTSEKRRNLLRSVMRADNILPVTVRDVRVGCQAVAAWFDHVLDDNLQQKNDASGSIAIVDIGGRTTDIATVVSGNAIDHSRSGTENIGVLDVYSQVAVSLRKQFKIKEKFPIDILDKAVRTGLVTLWNKQHNIEDVVLEAIQEHEGKIAREVQRRLGSAASFNAVVFVGGGANLFRSIANHFPNGHVAENPEFSNANGLYKFIKVKG
jgi:plasmid segregation protein ParM